MLVPLPTLTNWNLFTMNFTAANALSQAQNLAQPFILRAQLEDMTRANAFYKDIINDIKNADEGDGGAPEGEARLLREHALRALADFLGVLNNVSDELNKLNGKTLVPAPQLRETVYEVVGGFVAEGDQGVPLSQYMNMLYLSLGQMYGQLPQQGNMNQGNTLLLLQNRVSVMTSMFSAWAGATSFLQHRVVVDEGGRAVVQFTHQVAAYTVEDFPRAFMAGGGVTFSQGQSAYQRRAQYAQPESRVAQAAADDTSAVQNLTDAGLAEAEANARALAGINQQSRDPNAY